MMTQVTRRRQVSNGRSNPAPRGAFRDREEDALTKFLGWFSVGLGVAEVAAPGAVSELIGLRRTDEFLPAFGLREVATGVGILTNDRPAEWMWGRVLGDVMDLAYLGNALLSPNTDKGRVAGAALAVLGVTALDVLCAQQLSARPGRRNVEKPHDDAIQVHTAITINATAGELYGFWRNIENLPRIMRHLRSVETLDDTRSRWTSEAPMGEVSWEAEIVEDVPGERIGWRSLDGAAVVNSGRVSFRKAAGDRGTVVDVELSYQTPIGTLGAIIAFLLGQEPRQQIVEDLRAYKAFVETGEVPTTEGQPSGR